MLYASSPFRSRDPLLLRLPAELRNTIYEHALGHPEYEITSSLNTITKIASPSLGLLRTCRQIHNETVSLFWVSSTFDCHHGLRYLHMWLETQSFDRQAVVSSIRLGFYIELQWGVSETLTVADLDHASMQQELQSCELPGLKRVHANLHVVSWDYDYAMMEDWSGEKLAMATEKLFVVLKNYVEGICDGVEATFDMDTSSTQPTARRS
jgi:hypothetical protein